MQNALDKCINVIFYSETEVKCKWFVNGDSGGSKLSM